ncbi:MAG: FecR family protein [Myxococcota bacterium]
MSFEAKDPHLESHQTEQLWERIDATLSRPAPARRRMLLPLLVPLAAAALLMLLLPSDAPFSIEAGVSERRAELPTGGEALLAAGTALSATRNDNGTRFTLRGRATFDIPKRKGRKPIVVEAGAFEVRVIGTRFEVVSASATGAASVSVERGRVEVWEKQTRVASLGAGERYPAPAPQEPTVALEPAPEPEPEVKRKPRTDVSAATQKALANAKPEDFFVIANRARAAGDFREAATVYARFLQKHPEDARAGIAALELGRLQMDRLRQLKRARRSLERAKRLGVGPVEADLSYRLIRLYGKLGEVGACRREKGRHLSRFKQSVHRAQVEGSCEKP